MISQMPVRSGRIEKRIRLAVPVQISSLLDPAATVRTTTENVCSLGVRVLTERAMDLNERLMIRFRWRFANAGPRSLLPAPAWRTLCCRSRTVPQGGAVGKALLA